MYMYVKKTTTTKQNKTKQVGRAVVAPFAVGVGVLERGDRVGHGRAVELVAARVDVRLVRDHVRPLQETHHLRLRFWD